MDNQIDHRNLRITPTDVSQFIRLEQCERYLRLRLEERAGGLDFMRDVGIYPQTLPPLLTESGTQFEANIEELLETVIPIRKFAGGMRRPEVEADDNVSVAAAATALGPGDAVMLLQARLVATLDGWWVRGDVDALRLERDGGGRLHALITDMKSSKTSRMEHRLQVAFYAKLLQRVLAEARIAHEPIRIAILFRGENDDAIRLTDEQAATRTEQRAAAQRYFGTSNVQLDIISDATPFLEAVADLVTGPKSVARRLLETELEEIPFHLSEKCDSCLYNAWCMRRSAETDDLSLLPFLTGQDKRALQRNGIETIRDLAALKRLEPDGSGDRTVLIPQPGKEGLCRRLSATWPVGPRLDELIHRALRYRKYVKDSVEALGWIPHKGYGSLPYSGPDQNPNMIRIYIDAQHDYLHDRVYLLGALVVACENGIETDLRRRAVVRLAERPPDSAEREERLFVDWISETLRAVVEVAAPDEEGAMRAPVHVIFHDAFAQRRLLEGLARHAEAVLGATALYDFITQLAAFDSPIATVLQAQIREQKNYPFTCQSLQAVAGFLAFDWNTPEPYRDVFKMRLFDFRGRFDEPDDGSERPGRDGWYTRNARFSSDIPLEYAYAAWGELAPPPGRNDPMAAYRGATVPLLKGFQLRRLEAIEHIARQFAGNKQTMQRTFALPDLATFEQRARTLAKALEEFTTIERHVALGAWKRTRLAPPERRVLSGDTLIVRYLEVDQDPEVAERNRENERRRPIREQYRADFYALHPDAKRVSLTAEQRAESHWSQAGMRFRLRLDMAGVECDLDEALALSTLKPSDRLVLMPRLTTDSRLPENEQVGFTPTPKQMLYGMRASLDRILVERDQNDRAVAAFAEVVMQPNHGGSREPEGYVFGTMDERPLEPNKMYTLDSDPNDHYGQWGAKVVDDLVQGAPNTLLSYLERSERTVDAWPAAERDAQARFLAGLEALESIGALHGFEESKRAFIGGHGDEPLLLVQGPPGTGKSYSTAFALFARMQAALAGGRAFRIGFGCKTHAATDVLLENVIEVQRHLLEWLQAHPRLFAEYFDERLLALPVFRLRPRGGLPDGVIPLPRDDDREKGTAKAWDRISDEACCFVAGTPGGLYKLAQDHWGKKGPHGRGLLQCLVLDEASQINLPEAMMASVPLGAGGQLIVVGDHRQMPPIVSHDWSREPRRTFQEFRAFDSLFEALLPYHPPMIKFSESFRLHADMAEFLRREIYARDGIDYHSKRQDVLPGAVWADPFVAAALAPKHPMVVIVHDEEDSQMRNQFEQALLTPILEALTDPHGCALEPAHGLGVVVPHRAQRAALQEAFPERLTVLDPDTHAVRLSAVDTVERFQGGERTVIVVGATESDREYLLATSEFLLDPRRLTVALSRAKQKLILVASRSVFELFSTDEETFGNAQLWKNLLRRTCTEPLWVGELHGHRVEVWGNAPAGV